MNRATLLGLVTVAIYGLTGLGVMAAPRTASSASAPVASATSGTSTAAVFSESREARTARTKITQELIRQVSMALEKYKLDVGEFPTTDQGLTALFEKTGLPDAEAKRWAGPYLKPLGKRDAWNHALQYEVVEHAFHLWSEGPDGISGDDDDIRSWKE
jgi:general secretion pathway protein G